jgi:hypothetical protein
MNVLAGTVPFRSLFNRASIARFTEESMNPTGATDH